MIRPAHDDELDLLTSLARRSKAHWGYSEAFMRGCYAELTVRPEHLPHVYVIDDHARVEGFYAVSRLDATRAELEFLFVEPTCMRKGHGRRLVEHARQLLSGWGCRTLVIQGDPNALAFYQSVGALQVGQRASASIPGRMLPLLELDCGVPSRHGTPVRRHHKTASMKRRSWFAGLPALRSDCKK